MLAFHNLMNLYEWWLELHIVENVLGQIIIFEHCCELHCDGLSMPCVSFANVLGWMMLTLCIGCVLWVPWAWWWLIMPMHHEFLCLMCGGVIALFMQVLLSTSWLAQPSVQVRAHRPVPHPRGERDLRRKVQWEVLSRSATFLSSIPAASLVLPSLGSTSPHMTSMDLPAWTPSIRRRWCESFMPTSLGPLLVPLRSLRLGWGVSRWESP